MLFARGVLAVRLARIALQNQDLGRSQVVVCKIEQSLAGVALALLVTVPGGGLRFARAVLLPVVLVGGAPFTGAIAADFAVLSVVGEFCARFAARR
jgi:hypothetical protein